MSSKIVIFDMDGVLIDSEPAYHEMNKKLFIEFGIEMDDENYKSLVGLPSMPMWTMLKEKYKLKNEISDFIDLEKRRMRKILGSEKISAPVEGITGILKLLKAKNYKLSVASSSAKANINFVLKKLDLNEYFDFVISGDEVANGKPAPDIFLHVAEKFQSMPHFCYVIEDSLNGITAAKSAGMYAVGFSNNGSNSQDLSQSDLIIENFDKEGRNELIKFINLY